MKTQTWPRTAPRGDLDTDQGIADLQSASGDREQAIADRDAMKRAEKKHQRG